MIEDASFPVKSRYGYNILLGTGGLKPLTMNIT